MQPMHHPMGLILRRTTKYRRTPAFGGSVRQELVKPAMRGKSDAMQHHSVSHVSPILEGLSHVRDVSLIYAD